MYLEDDGMPVKWSLLKVWPTPSSPCLQIPLDLTQKFSAFVMRYQIQRAIWLSARAGATWKVAELSCFKNLPAGFVLESHERWD